MPKISWELPIKTVSEANSSEHWTKKAKRHKQQQFFLRLSYEKNVRDLTLPCKIILTRLSPRVLDEDNLTMAFKYIRDELSECIFPEKTGFYVKSNGTVSKIKGKADSDPRLSWQYKQEKSQKYGIRIEIEC